MNAVPQPGPAASPPIRNVSDTALWVAFYRALESDRPDAHFHDPYARRLAGERGEAIARAMPDGLSMAWPMIVRTCVFDELLLGRLRAGDVDAVVNLAAGLDARPWRMDLAASLAWYDVDLPGILEYKAAQLAGERPRCAYQARAADLARPGTRRAALAQIAALHRNVVVLTEGLLIYLEPDQVAALARDLAEQPSLRSWILDLASPQLLKFMEKRWSPAMRAGNAAPRFGPPENTRYFEPHGWREAEYRSIWEEAARLKRQPPLAWLWRLLGLFAPPSVRRTWKRFSGVARMERIPPT